VARNAVSRQVVEIEGRGNATFDDLRDLVAGTRGRTVFEHGDPDRGTWSSGLSRRSSMTSPTVAELMERIVLEAEESSPGAFGGCFTQR
jgi:nitronate monooxygenase